MQIMIQQAECGGVGFRISNGLSGDAQDHKTIDHALISRG